MYCNNNKKYKCFMVILYICLLNIVINNVSLSNEDIIISKQEFQKLLDIKHNITGLKKISETMFELMFNTNDDEEETKPTTANAGMKENKGLDDRTTGEIIGDGGEREKEQEEKETDNTGKRTACICIDLNKMNKSYDEYTQSIIELVSIQNESLMSISNMSREILEWISKYIKKQLESQDSQPTKQEIAEIVNNAISSYNETNKKNIEELNKQNMKESDLYQTQIIQMFKDLIENVNKLNNKVDRLEGVVSQKIDIINKQENSEVSGKFGIVRVTKVNMEDFRILGAGLGNLVSEDTQAEEAEEK